MPASAQVGHRPLGALFELHIEQGPILEAEGRRIGVVTGGQGARWYDCEVIGAEAHAGPTPMEARRDALRAAAELLGEIYQIAHRPGAGRPRHGRRVARLSRLAQHRAGPGRASRSTCAIPTAARWTRWTMRCARRSSGRAAAAAGLEFHLHADLVRAAGGVRPRLHRGGAPGGGGARPARARDRQRRRPRCGLHGARRADRDDLRAVQGRHQPQRGRVCLAARPATTAPTCCCTRCWRAPAPELAR